MKKAKIKPFPAVKKYAQYFKSRAKRVLGLTKAEYDSYHIDLHDLESVDVWFFSGTKVLARAKFTSDGKIADSDDIIDNRK